MADLKNNKIFITGGSGYLPARISEFFASKNYNIVNFSSSKISEFNNKNIESIFSKWSDLSLKNIKFSNVLIHAAGPNSNFCNIHPDESKFFSKKSAQILTSIFNSFNFDLFVFISSAHVYKSPLTGIIDEDTALLNKNPYALCKIETEKYLKHNIPSKKLKIIRLSNGIGSPVFKDTNCWNLLVNEIISNIFKKKNTEIRSPKSILRNYIAIDDLCKFIEILIEKKINIENNIINLGGSKSVSIEEIVELIFNLTPNNYKKYFNVKFTNSKNIKNESLIYKSKSDALFRNILSNNLNKEIINLNRNCEEWFGV